MGLRKECNKPIIRVMKTNLRFTIWIKWVLGFVFIVSSILKSINIHSFAMETVDFIDMYMPSWLHGFQYPCAMIVCQSELVLGLLALKEKYRHIAFCGMFLLLTFFVWLTMINAFFPTIFGSIESCGCFGELIHFTPIASFIKSVVLWILAGGMLSYEWRQKGCPSVVIGDISITLLKDGYLWISVSAGWCLLSFSYFYVNKLDHDLYLMLYMGICITIAIVSIWCGKYKY